MANSTDSVTCGYIIQLKALPEQVSLDLSDEDRFLDYKAQLDIARVQTIFNGLLAIGIALASVGFGFLSSNISIIVSNPDFATQSNGVLEMLSLLGLVAMLVGLAVVGFSIIAPFRKFSKRIDDLGGLDSPSP